MTMNAVLLGLAVATPLALLGALLAVPFIGRYLPVLLALAPVPAGIAAVFSGGGTEISLPGFFEINLAVDMPGAVLLGASAFLWAIAGLSAPKLLGERPGKVAFAAWWLLTLSGSMGVFIAADLPTFYLFFTIVSLAAYGLVVHDGTAQANTAGKIYFSASLVGEVCLLAGFVLLAGAAPQGSLMIADVVPAIAQSPWRDAALAGLMLGFGLKIGLVPLHFWLPIAHPAAPAPASAVLSGAIIKSGVIGLLRFMPIGTTPLGWGEALVFIGFITAFWGVVLGVTQRNPKAVLAYSSVSQMGVVAAAFGMGIVGGVIATPALVAYYALHHVLAKGALFLAVGVIAATGGAARAYVLIPAAVLAVGFGGLPLTGGAFAKYAIKPLMGSGTAATLAILSAAGSTLLMLHFLRRLGEQKHEPGKAGEGMWLVWPWLACALSAIVVPWLLFEPVTGVAAGATLAAAELWSALWPMGIGALAAFLLSRVELPAVRPGDVIFPVQRAGAPVGAWIGKVMDDIEAQTRRWPVAGMLFLLITLVFWASLSQARP
jgi:formate hydrogenlyase subunit 3/multisubunit Na+/H+ antiporter MnhD subunit